MECQLQKFLILLSIICAIFDYICTEKLKFSSFRAPPSCKQINKLSLGFFVLSTNETFEIRKTFQR